jgi:hypothetical protein
VPKKLWDLDEDGGEVDIKGMLLDSVLGDWFILDQVLGTENRMKLTIGPAVEGAKGLVGAGVGADVFGDDGVDSEVVGAASVLGAEVMGSDLVGISGFVDADIVVAVVGVEVAGTVFVGEGVTNKIYVGADVVVGASTMIAEASGITIVGDADAVKAEDIGIGVVIGGFVGGEDARTSDEGDELVFGATFVGSELEGSAIAADADDGGTECGVEEVGAKEVGAIPVGLEVVGATKVGADVLGSEAAEAPVETNTVGKDVFGKIGEGTKAAGAKVEAESGAVEILGLGVEAKCIWLEARGAVLLVAEVKGE